MFENMTTMQLVAWIKANAEAGNWLAAFDELEAREIKENDVDDGTAWRGGIRSGHTPIVP